MKCPICGNFVFTIISGGAGSPHTTYECTKCKTRVCVQEKIDEYDFIRKPYHHNPWTRIDKDKLFDEPVKVVFT